MAPRKRSHEEMESSEPAPEPTLLERLRNTWEFANLMQYIFFFGDVVKLDKDLDIEVSFLQWLFTKPSISHAHTVLPGDFIY